MQTQIVIEVPHKGGQPGTLGWLVEQPIKIKIGTCKGSCSFGCWLHIGSSSELVSLEGYSYHPEVGFLVSPGINEVEVARISGSRYEEREAFSVTWTDAAWCNVEELVCLAREKFATWISERDKQEQEENVSFTITRAE